MTENYETYLDSLRTPAPRAGGGLVRSQDNTIRAEASKAVDPAIFDGADSLFGDSSAYQVYKREKPEHRLMLWLRLNGHNVKETATLTGYTPQSVSQVCKQPWFREAFCKLSTEMGKDIAQTLLEGEVVPTIHKLVELRDSAESEAVRKAACDSILDRYLGKPTVKVEQKLSGSVDSVVYDAAKLIAENKRITDELRTRIGSN